MILAMILNILYYSSVTHNIDSIINLDSPNFHLERYITDDNGKIPDTLMETS